MRESIHRVAVKGNKQHVIAGIKYVLCAVAVVKVNIKNCDAFGTRAQQMLCCNGSVVHKTIATIHVGCGMMAGWTAQRENGFGTVI